MKILRYLALLISIGTAFAQQPSTDSTPQTYLNKIITSAGNTLTIDCNISSCLNIASVVQVKPTARLATTAALPTNVYNNGTSGVGATLTGVSVGGLTVDGQNVAVNDVVLVQNESAGANNGLYSVTATGSVAAVYVLTRNVEMNTASEFSGALVPVGSAGTVNANTLWLANPSTPVTVGTTSIPFTQLNGGTDLVAGSGISISGNTVSQANINPGNVSCNSGSSAAAPAGCPTSSVRYSSAGAFSLVAGDNGGIVSQSQGANACTGTIAQSGSTGFPAGSYTAVLQNSGSTPCILTPTTSTINGGTTFKIPAGSSAVILADSTSSPGNYVGIVLSPGVAISLAQSGLPMIMPPSGYMDATANVVLGQNPPGTVYLSSSTAGSGITITCNTACFTGTSAGDTGRQFTFSDGTCCASAKTFSVTGNSGSSTTVAQGTLNTTLTTACTSGSPCAASSIYETGPIQTVTNAAANSTTYSVPLNRTYASAYLYFPASSPIGTAGQYYCTMASPNLSLLKCYNNAYTPGTPTIPASPTAFSGLTPAAYTQTTGVNAVGGLTVTVPANSMGISGRVQVNALLSNNNSSNIKYINSQWGGVSKQLYAGTTSPGYGLYWSITNQGVTGAQVAGGYNGDIGNNNTQPLYYSVDTTTNETLQIPTRLSTATDSMVLESGQILLYPSVP